MDKEPWDRERPIWALLSTGTDAVWGSAHWQGAVISWQWGRTCAHACLVGCPDPLGDET